MTRDFESDARRRIPCELLPAGGDTVWMQQPFFCDFGTNTELGERVYFNFNCVVLDICRVRICDFSFFGPGVQIYTALHPSSEPVASSPGHSRRRARRREPLPGHPRDHRVVHPHATDWEQGPDGPVIALLRIAARHPRIIRENLESAA